MASARARALRVVGPVPMEMPFRLSEPLPIPLDAAARLSALPVAPKVPPVTVPNWKVRVVGAPAPMVDDVLA